MSAPVEPVFSPLPSPPLVRVVGEARPLTPQQPTAPFPRSAAPFAKQQRGRVGSVQRDLLPVREIIGDVLCLRPTHRGAHPAERRYVAILDVGSTNLRLRSDDEQEAIVQAYRTLLKALTFPIQILARSTPLDLSDYLAHLATVAADPTVSPTWHALAHAHRAFTQELAAQHALTERRFCVVVPAQLAPLPSHPLRWLARHSAETPRDTHALHAFHALHLARVQAAQQQLAIRVELLMQHLIGMGLSVRRLAGDELAFLLAESLLPHRAQHPLLREAVRAACEGTSQQAPTLPPLTSLPSTASSLVDVLAPLWVQESRDALCIEGQYTRCLAITGLPREVSIGWLAPLIQHEATGTVVLHLHPQDSSRMVRQLLRRQAEVRSARRMSRQRGAPEHPDAVVAETDLDALKSKLASGEERVVATSLTVQVSAPDREQLDARTQQLLGVVHDLLLVGRPTTFEQRRGWQTCLPCAEDALQRTMPLDSTSLATAFPFVSESLTMPHGVLEGSSSTGEPLLLDAWDSSLDNPHRFIGAITGAGKSYYAKLMIVRELLMHPTVQITVIDPEQEYAPLCTALGGTSLRLAPGAEQHLNPFDLLPAGMTHDSSPRTRGDRLAEKVQSLHTFCDLLLADRGPTGVTALSSREKGLLDRALYETYRRAGITADPTTHTRLVPLLRDLSQVLVEGRCGTDTYGLADRLSRYVDGSLSGLFNAPTDVSLSNRLVVCDIRDLSGDLRPIAIFLIADFLWTQVLAERKPRALYLDEAWSLIAHPEGGRFLADLTRRARKHYLRLVTITQNPEQFVEDQWGSVIAANAAIKVLKKQDRTSADAVARTFHLTTSEQQRLLTLSKAEALVLVGTQRMVVTVEANPLEHALATTDPRELAERHEEEAPPSVPDAPVVPAVLGETPPVSPVEAAEQAASHASLESAALVVAETHPHALPAATRKAPAQRAEKKRSPSGGSASQGSITTRPPTPVQPEDTVPPPETKSRPSRSRTVQSSKRPPSPEPPAPATLAATSKARSRTTSRPSS